MLVFYELTQACDLVCRHCRACAKPTAAPNELDTAQSKRMIDQLTEFPDPPMLILTGGDPLKRADVYDLIEYAVSAGLDVSITPSATPLVTRDAIIRLRDAGISRMAISIDGKDAQTHDANRGVAGSFQRSLDILREARELGVETQINTTLTPGNVDQIEAMADCFGPLDIALWSVFFLVPMGRADEMARLNADESEQAFMRLWEQSQKQPYMVKTTEAPHYRRFVIQHRVTSSRSMPAIDADPTPRFVPIGVNDGKGVMFVGHTGKIYPSGFLPITCGKFPEDDLVHVYQDSTVFRCLRTSKLLEGKCGRCEFKNFCGGSRARAYAVTGNILSEEPDCNYVPL